jgi:hypothetical protein
MKDEGEKGTKDRKGFRAFVFSQAGIFVTLWRSGLFHPLRPQSAQPICRRDDQGAVNQKAYLGRMAQGLRFLLFHSSMLPADCAPLDGAGVNNKGGKKRMEESALNREVSEKARNKNHG